MIEEALTMPGAATREEEYGRILRNHGRAVRRIVRSYERDAAAQQDLEQDIWVALLQALPAFRGDCSIRTFVFRTAHNRAVTHGQRQRRTAADRLPADALLYDPGRNPEDAAAHEQHQQRLRDAVHALPLALRQVVVLLLEGLSHAEIGEVLGISAGSVAVRLTRAQAALRAGLGASETAR